MVEPATGPAIGVSTVGMTKIFGSLRALEDVSIEVRPGTLHALLGENGAGKSTLVKCMMGFYQPTRGQLIVDGREEVCRNPRDAMKLKLGMVYQHFTLVPSLTAAENLVISRPDCPAVIDWGQELASLEAFMERMPFKVPLRTPVSSLAAGEKQKLEILKQLYLDRRFLILDEPTSVLTPQEADEMLGLLKGMTSRGEITILMISHKFREVNAYADEVSVLRRGRYVGGGKVGELSTDDMARMMIGDTKIRERAARAVHGGSSPVAMELAAIHASDDEGLPALESIDLKVHAGEIVGVAGVSGNGQSELVEVLSGQRDIDDGRILVQGRPFEPVRGQMDDLKVFALQEEPLRNSAVPGMSVAENMALRTFDKPPISLGAWFRPGPMRAAAREMIEKYRVKTPSTETPIRNLSGGNVQRAVLARELSGDVAVLVVANPCFGLDFASVSEIRSQIMDQRNRGAGVLLVSEDLDEILELADRVVVMSEGRITYSAPIQSTDRQTIGHAMAGGH